MWPRLPADRCPAAAAAAAAAAAELLVDPGITGGLAEVRLLLGLPVSIWQLTWLWSNTMSRNPTEVGVEVGMVGVDALPPEVLPMDSGGVSGVYQPPCGGG